MATPLPGHSIPYALTPAEIQAFLAVHRDDLVLAVYLNDKHNPPYGIVVNEDYGQLLVWFDASDVLHVIDITNLAIANAVQQAPYESPDSSLLHNLAEEFQKLLARLNALGTGGLEALPWLIGGFIAFEVWKGQK